MVRNPVVFIANIILLGTIVTFFGSHIVFGDRGLLARPALERKIIEAQDRLHILKKHKQFLEQRILLLQSGFIDADILGEKARSELGLYGANDVIISIDSTELKF